MPALQEQHCESGIGPLRGVQGVPSVRLDRQRNRIEEKAMIHVHFIEPVMQEDVRGVTVVWFHCIHCLEQFPFRR